MVRKRNHGISNLFSESHRKCLPGNFCLWDIDGFFIDDNDQILGIYEGKHKLTTNDKGHFIKTFYSISNIQASFLRHLSVYFPVWINEESTRKWWKVELGLLSESKDPDTQLIKTENKIYVEDVLNKTKSFHNPVAVFLRTEGEKNIEKNIYSDFIASKFKIPQILVNDVLDENLIYFKRDEKMIGTSVDPKESLWLRDWRTLQII